MNHFGIPAIAASALVIAGCAAQQNALAEEAEPWQQARVVGEAQSCIPLQQIRDTTVRDDQTIDFRMSGGRTYRNTLPARCGGLGAERRFSYATSTSQLCSSDIITVLREPIGTASGPSCGLGDFVPVEIPES